MNSISPVNTVNPAAYSRAAEGSYESNLRQYGPVVATAVGAAEAAGAGASAVVSFSSESLQKLGEALESGYDEVVDVAGAVGDTVGSALGTVGQYAALGVAAGRQFFGDLA